MRLSILVILFSLVCALPLYDSEKLAYSELVELVGDRSVKRDLSQPSSNLTIVMFEENCTISAKLTHVKSLLSTNSSIQQLYDIGKFETGSGVVGYVGNFCSEALEMIQKCPAINVLQGDQIVRGGGKMQKGAAHTLHTRELQNRDHWRTDNRWYLSRISHRENTLNSDYIVSHDPMRPTDVYIIDSGVRVTHESFNGRAKWGANFHNEINTDENGHGTGVAGVAASVSPHATLIGVKVLGSDNTGSLAGVLAGLEWALNQASSSNIKSIINMSFGSSSSAIYEPLIKRAVDMGVPLVFSAGNLNEDACSISPAESSSRYPGVFTVGSSNEKDVQSTFSGWGKCVSLLAPGENIYAPTAKSDSSYTFWEGTSMSSPQVTGLASYWLSVLPLDLPSLDWLLTQNRGRVQVKNNTPSILAWNMYI